MPSSPVRNAGLPKPSKCRLIRESFYISAPVAARYFIPKQEFVVSIVPTQINTAQQNKGKKMCIIMKHEIDRRLDVLYGLSEKEIKIIEAGKI